MALVTCFQRNGSESNGPTQETDDARDNSSKTVKSLSECYFARKGSSTMESKLGNMATELSSSQTSIGSVGSDIALHLQSMFCLLRPEETLKMAVKLESLRAGRTRYLVVVSRPGTKKISASNSHQQQKLYAHTVPLPANQPMSVNTKTTNNMTKIVLSSSSTTSHSNTENIYHQCSTDSKIFDTVKNSSLKNNETDCDTTKLENVRKYDLSAVSDGVSLKSGSNDKNSVEECCLLGIDCNEMTTVGLVLKVLADTSIRLDGDGGFSVNVCGNQHIFKPVSVQAMWSALQTLHKVSSKAREHNFFAGGNSHEWVQYYEQRIESERSCLNEWHAMDSLESRRPQSPDTINRNKPTERGDTERVIRTALKEIMISVDLDEVTSKYIRVRLEEHLDMDLIEFKSFIDQEMLVILGQMDAPTEIFEHVYLGSEWNASNLEELQRNGVHHILNVTREIDNFFPGLFDYFNVRVYDDEKTDLLKHWDNTFKYISRAKTQGSKVLVHCKMGISRSASVVIAYAMKAHNWNFDQAIKHVKDKRSCIKPNKSFLTQLETYQGILAAMKNKGKIIDKLQRSKSETNLKSNSNTKEGRMLAGSEPTPLIQALQCRTYPSTKKDSQLKRVLHQRRPNSWSSEEKTNTSVALTKLSASLETLVSITDNNNKESVACNVRVPCKNGQHHYSITQNKIMYLEDVDFHAQPNSEIPKEISGSYNKHRMISKDRRLAVEDLKLPFLDNTLEQSHKALRRPNENIMPSESDEIAWHPGTVKRTMMKIEATSEATNFNKILCDIKTALLIDNLSNLSKKYQDGSSSSRLPILTHHTCNTLIETRCKSEELIPVTQVLTPSTQFTYLSVSAPHSYCTKTLATLDKRLKNDQRRQQFRKHCASNDDKNTNNNEMLGKVKNLKMSFEAKTQSSDRKLISKSLPSSPISIHIDVMSNPADQSNFIVTNKKLDDFKIADDCKDEFMDNNVKGMVDRFEVTKMRHQKPSLGFRHLQRPKSLYSPLSSHNPIHLKHSTIFIPPQMQTNNLLGSAGPINSKTSSTGLNCTTATTYRKMQQHGRTHPLTIMNKQRFNPTTAYNTM